MPTPPLEETITKVTLNLYTRDLADLRRLEDNWSSKVRELIRIHCNAVRLERRNMMIGKRHMDKPNV